MTEVVAAVLFPSFLTVLFNSDWSSPLLNHAFLQSSFHTASVIAPECSVDVLPSDHRSSV